MKGQVGRVFSVREISKEVDADRYARDKTWASRELKSLCNKGYIEAINGCYWIPPEEEKERENSDGNPENGEESDKKPQAASQDENETAPE